MAEATHDYKEVTLSQSVAAILWPSFLTAGLLTVFVFAFFDPLDLLASRGVENISSMGAYSLGFLGFWVVTALSSAGTRYFLKPCELVNRVKK